MLWSYWKYSGTGLQSPNRPKAYPSREEAVQSIGPRHRARKDLNLVCLYLRVDGGYVVPEFGIQALGRDWSLPCRRHGGAVVIYGAVPEALWHTAS